MKKMSRRLLGVFFAVCATCSLLLLAGCSSDTVKNVVVIYSDNAVSSASPESAISLIEEAKKTEGYVSFVRLDGTPKVTASEQTEFEAENSKNEEQEVNAFTKKAMKILNDMKAEAEEIDLLAAVKLANSELEKAAVPKKGDSENVVVIVGTALSTYGAINFAKNPLSTVDLEDYASSLEKSGKLPDLSNIDKIV